MPILELLRHLFQESIIIPHLITGGSSPVASAVEAHYSTSLEEQKGFSKAKKQMTSTELLNRQYLNKA